jgi:Rrf2 family protein
MLTLTKRTEYAMIAACHLANVGERIVSARDLSELYNLRLPLLMNVLKLLNQGGILRSVRGARGGYALAVPAKQVTLSELIEAVEGPPRLIRCARPQPNDPPCEMSGACPVRGPMAKVHRMFGAFLAGVTIADVAYDDGYTGRKLKDLQKAATR